MPLSEKYQKMLDAMIEEYGAEKGKQVFYAKMNKEGIEPEAKSYVFNSSSLKSLDGDYVEGYLSTSDKDLVNDIVTPHCLVDMLQQLQNRPVTVDVEHESFRGKDHIEKELNKALIPEGKVVEASLDSKGIKVKTMLNSHHSKYEEVKNSIKEGFLHAYSIAYTPQEFKHRSDGVRLLDRVNLLNITYTGTPVNPEASITNVMLKSIQEGGIEMEAQAKAAEAGAKLENLEVKSLSEKVESLNKEITQLKATALKKAEEENGKKKDDKDEEDKDDEEDDEKKKEAEAKKKAFESQEAQVKALEARLKAIETALSKPQLKAIIEANIEQKSAVENQAKAIKGPVDLIN